MPTFYLDIVSAFFTINHVKLQKTHPVKSIIFYINVQQEGKQYSFKFTKCFVFTKRQPM